MIRMNGHLCSNNPRKTDILKLIFPSNITAMCNSTVFERCEKRDASRLSNPGSIAMLTPVIMGSSPHPSLHSFSTELNAWILRATYVRIKQKMCLQSNVNVLRVKIPDSTFPFSVFVKKGCNEMRRLASRFQFVSHSARRWKSLNGVFIKFDFFLLKFVHIFEFLLKSDKWNGNTKTHMRFGADVREIRLMFIRA